MGKCTMRSVRLDTCSGFDMSKQLSMDLIPLNLASTLSNRIELRLKKYSGLIIIIICHCNKKTTKNRWLAHTALYIECARE